MVRLLLIRHAATNAFVNNAMLGSTDMGASSAGLDRVERLLPFLKEYEPDTWYCSPMRRAVQTAERLQNLTSRNFNFIEDERIREIDFGRWEQKTYADIEASDPDLIPGWCHYDDFTFPEGESVAGFVGRVGAVLDELSTSGKNTIGVVTHGGVIRTMICLALGLSTKNYLLFTVHPASLTILDLYPQGGILTGLNI